MTGRLVIFWGNLNYKISLMKKIAFLLALSLITSCSTTKYNITESKYNFDDIKAGTKYTFYDKNDRKFFVQVTSVEKDSIKGLKKKEEFKIAKNDIKEIKKNRNGATIALVAGGVAVIGFTWIMVNVMKDIGKVTGAVLGGNR